MSNGLIKKLKEIEIISRETVNLKNAGVSNFYVDVKKAYGYPDVLNLISDKLYEKIGKEVTCIAGSGHGGIPIATTISSNYDLLLTLIRDEPKKYGRNTSIDGHVPNNQDKIAIVDDVFTTGNSLRKIINILESTGAEIIGNYVVVKRGEGKLKFPVIYLLKAEELF